MSNLTKEQKDELVTSYAALALYDGDVSSSNSLGDGREGWVWVRGKRVDWRGFSPCFFPPPRPFHLIPCDQME